MQNKLEISSATNSVESTYGLLSTLLNNLKGKNVKSPTFYKCASIIVSDKYYNNAYSLQVVKKTMLRLGLSCTLTKMVTKEFNNGTKKYYYGWRVERAKYN